MKASVRRREDVRDILQKLDGETLKLLEGLCDAVYRPFKLCNVHVEPNPKGSLTLWLGIHVPRASLLREGAPVEEHWQDLAEQELLGIVIRASEIREGDAPS